MSRLADISEHSDRSMANRMTDALRLFTEQSVLLQTAIVSSQTTTQNHLQVIVNELQRLKEQKIQMRSELSSLEQKIETKMNSIQNEVNQLRAVISSNQNTRDAFDSYRQAMDNLLKSNNDHHEKEVQRTIEIYERLSIRNQSAAPAIAPQVVQPQAPATIPAQKPPANIVQQNQAAVQPVSQLIKQQPAIVPPVQQTQAGLIQPGEWECSGCMVRNGAAVTVCPCCSTPKGAPSSTSAASVKPAAPFKPQQFAAPAQQSSGGFFGSTANQPAAQKSTPAATPVGAAAQFGSSTASPNSGFSFLSKSESPAVMQAPPQQAQNQQSQKISFSFQPNLFGSKTPTTGTPTTVSPAVTTSSSTGLFGSPGPKTLFGGGTTFGSVANQSPNASWLNKNDSNADKFKANPKEFGLFSQKTLQQPSKPKAADDEDGDQDNTAPEDFVPDDTQFIRPNVELPSLVEQRTGEENEDILFQSRARVYRYVPESREVKERGTGELKILKHKETKKVRVLMRRDQTYKLCANFNIPQGFSPTFSKGRESTLVWTCTDFSETDEHPDGDQMTMLCRFKDKEAATEFKRIVESNQ
ncbi:RanBD1 domain-containing protein [Aphelenchoides besseyi]|nr:RanBD1 domain-containing protein [Aphelenchoides besseyi]